MKIKEQNLILKDKAVNNKKNLTAFIIISIIAVVYFGVLAYLFPYSGDDWSWGGVRGVEWLKSGFQDLNGRYSGNLLVMLLTRVPACKVIIMSLSYYLVCFFSFRFSGSKHISSFIFSLFSFFTVSSGVISQAIVWTSGFSNYVPPIILIMGYILLVSNIIKDEMPSYRKYLPILTFIIGLIGAMFMENLTIYSVIVAIGVIIYCYVKHKKVFAVHISYFIGALLGAVAMFSNPIYRNVLRGDDYYRNIAVNKDNPFTFIIEHLNTICMRTFICEVVILIVITILASILVKNNLKEGIITNKKTKKLLISCCIMNSITLFCFFIKSFIPGWGFAGFKYSSELTTVTFALLCIIYFFSLSTIVLMCLNNQTMRIKAAFILISIPIMVAPLIFVSPIGSRNFFSVFFMWMMLASILFKSVIGSITVSSKMPKRLMIAVSVLLVVFSSVYLCVFAKIHSNDIERIASSLEQSKKGDVVIVHKLEDYDLVWDANPIRGSREETYKEFYGIDPDDEIVYVR